MALRLVGCQRKRSQVILVRTPCLGSRQPQPYLCSFFLPGAGTASVLLPSSSLRHRASAFRPAHAKGPRFSRKALQPLQLIVAVLYLGA